VVEIRSVSSIAVSRRRACHTIATNIAAISGTSVSSSSGCAPRATSIQMNAAVVAMTPPRTRSVGRTCHTRKP
jgi:hypothetical protein